MKRFLVLAAVVVVVLVAAAALLLRYYLHSARVAQQVTTRIEALYGGPVRVEGVDVGLGASSVNGFELFEEGADAGHARPWLKVNSIHADVSLWDLVRGDAMPRRVDVTGAQILFRFDGDGHLITRFPAHSGTTGTIDLTNLPEVVLQQADVVFRKEGQPDLVAKNVSARLTRGEDGKFALSGTGDSPELGQLGLSGTLDPSSRQAAATLKTAGTVHVTQAVLDRVPFVPAFTWEEVRIAEGETAAELTVRYDLGGGPFHYRLALAPTRTTVSVPSFGLTAHDASGTLVVDDNLAQLRGARGKAYGGTVAMDADLDFRGAVSALNFSNIKVKGLSLNDLPESWSIPEVVRRTAAKGKLSGTASLKIEMGPGPVAPTTAEAFVGLAGTPNVGGRWLPAVAVLSAFPHREIRTESQGKGQVIDPSVSDEPIEFDWKLGVPRRRLAPAPRTSRIPSPAEQLLLTAAITQTGLTQGVGAGEGYPPLNLKLGRVGDDLLRGVNGLLHDVVHAGSAFVQAAPIQVKPAPAAPNAPVSYLDLNLKLKHVDLAKFVKSLGVKIDFPVEGKLSFQVKVSIPTDKTGDLKLYKARGTAQVTDLRFAGVRAHEIDGDIDYAGGVLNLTSLRGHFRPPAAGEDPKAGTFTGDGKMQVAPMGDVSAELTLDRVPLSDVAGLAGDKVALAGTFSGRLSARAPANRLKDVTAIEANGKLTSDQVTVQGLALRQAALTLRLQGGILSLPDITGNLEGTPVAAAAELRLAGDYPFRASLALKNWDLSALEKLAGKGKEMPVLLAGAFTTSVDINGTLRPLKVKASGNASTAGLKVNAFQVSNVKFHWETDGRKLDLTGVDAHLYGGQAGGSAVLPLDPAATGTVNLKLSNLDAAQLVKDLAVNVKIDGKVGGTVKGTLPPAPDGKPRTATLDLDVTAPKLRVQNIPTEQLHGKVDYKGGIVDYKLEAKALGGTIELDGQIPSTPPAKKGAGKGRLRIDNVELARLAAALKLQENVQVSGRLSVELDYNHDTPDGSAVGRGRLRIANLRWQDRLAAAGVEGELILGGGFLRLREVEGEIAQGTFRAGLAINVRDPRRSTFAITLENVEAAQLLGAWLGDDVKGPLSTRIRGNLGDTWRGTADITLSAGKVFGMDVGEWRLPIDWEYAPAGPRWSINVYDTSAQLARGRVLGKLSITYEYVARVEGQVRFFGIDMQALVRRFSGSSSTLVGGQMSGTFDFSGSEVRSVNDLVGTLNASFQQAQPLQIPGLSAITPYIGMGPSTTFQRGVLKGRLDRGTFRIQQMALTGGTLMLHIDGTVTLGGRLDLNVIAKTGDVGLPTLRLGVIGIGLPIAGPLPVTALREASNLLANRVIYLTVTGTVRNPVIRVQPLRMLTEEAFRFFLNQSNLPVPITP